MTIDWVAIRRDRTVYEDDSALVLDKPPGVAVTGERHDTDLMAEARAAGEWLMPAHRIDKVTSGLVLLARSAGAHRALTNQFRDQSVDKAYLAITCGERLPDGGTIDLPLRVGRKNRMRVAAERDAIEHDELARRWSTPESARQPNAADATTTFECIWRGDRHDVVVATPRTGRRHQIRVHLAWIGAAVVGDPLYGGDGRVALHSWRLGFESPAVSSRVNVRRDPEVDFWSVLGADAEFVRGLVRDRG